VNWKAVETANWKGIETADWKAANWKAVDTVNWTVVETAKGPDSFVDLELKYWSSPVVSSSREWTRALVVVFC
jgi:hypothetical protein